jgi:hypothetical protein
MRIKTVFTLKEVRTLMFRAFAAGGGQAKLRPGFSEWNMNRKELRQLFPKVFFTKKWLAAQERRLMPRENTKYMADEEAKLQAHRAFTAFRKSPNWKEILSSN